MKQQLPMLNSERVVLSVMNKKKTPSAGFTLIETIVALTVLAVLGVLATFVIVQGNQQLAYAGELDRATRLGELYMDEIIATRRWDELSYRLNTWTGAIPTARAAIGAEEQNRENFDDCDDYDGFFVAGNHTTKDGLAIGTQYDPFSVRIDVDFVDHESLAAVEGPTDLKRIRVNVQWRNIHTIELNLLLANV